MLQQTMSVVGLRDIRRYTAHSKTVMTLGRPLLVRVSDEEGGTATSLKMLIPHWLYRCAGAIKI